MARALTPEETERFDAIQHASNIALLNVTLPDGTEKAVIVAVNQDNGSYILSPLAILLNPDEADELVASTPTATDEEK